ncbi:MAG: MFS transporter [Pseudomonadota bacterium]
MKKYYILICAVLMQLCLGATYSWSVYVASLKSMTGLGQGPVQLPFSVFYFVFPLTMVVSGSILARRGPRFNAVLGGILFGSGWILAGFGKAGFSFTVSGIGLLAGVGAGLAYIVPISTCIQWFPKHKGAVTGIAVAGFGGGAAIVSQVAGFMMASLGKTPFEVFFVFGGLFLFLIPCAGLIMQPAPGEAAAGKEPLPLTQFLSKPVFWMLYFAMFAGLAAGFAVNANLKELYTGTGIRAGITAVSLFALANAAGRIIWGFLFDRIRPRHALRANLLCQAALLFSSAMLLRSETGLLVFAVLAGFNYGGVLVLYASSAAGIWGNHRMAQVYGWLFSANIPAALSPMLAGWGFDTLGSFILPFGIIGVVMIAALVLIPSQVNG